MESLCKSFLPFVPPYAVLHTFPGSWTSTWQRGIALLPSPIKPSLDNLSDFFSCCLEEQHEKGRSAAAAVLMRHSSTDGVKISQSACNVMANS